MTSLIITITLTILAIAAVIAVAFHLYIAIFFTPVVARIFQAKPMFLPLRAESSGDGEHVRFPTPDGFSLAGSYYASRTRRRLGVLVFCHEYLSDRRSALPYADHLRDLGFDLFAFDFRNHGESDVDPNYHPYQWMTDLEVLDLRSALNYLRSRPDHDPAGFGLFGISRGGGTALYVGAKDPNVWGVVSDGAFGTSSTMLAYTLRWAEIYVGSRTFLKCLPRFTYRFLGWATRKRTQFEHGRRYPHLERTIGRLSPRPLLMIHGARDNYIGPDLARSLFDRAGDPKELWIVPKAKHNRCRDIDPEAYADRLASFFKEYAPRVSRPEDQSISPVVAIPATDAIPATVPAAEQLGGVALSS